MVFKRLLTVLLFLAIQSQASWITAHIAADNSFAVYTGNADGTELTYIGRNTAHWLTTHEFGFDQTEGDYIYLAAWSDDGTAQGIIGQFDVKGGPTILTGSNWDAHLTDKDIDDYFDTRPTDSDVALEIHENVWADVTNTLDNGSGPWGLRPDISSSADWMWGSPLQPGSGDGEYQIFRMQVGSANVPEPGIFILLSMGLMSLASVGFRRKK